MYPEFLFLQRVARDLDAACSRVDFAENFAPSNVAPNGKQARKRGAQGGAGREFSVK